jgi:hypothetical protein
MKEIILIIKANFNFVGLKKQRMSQDIPFLSHWNLTNKQISYNQHIVP